MTTADTQRALRVLDRARKAGTVIRVEDLQQDDAIAFLQYAHGYTRETAEEAYDIATGKSAGDVVRL